MFLNTAVAVLPSLSTPWAPAKCVPLALTAGSKTLSPPSTPQKTLWPLSPTSSCLFFSSGLATFYRALDYHLRPEGPGADQKKKKVALQAVMFCGDSADWMWHLKLHRSDCSVITCACIIYKQGGTAKFNSRGESIVFVFAALWFQDCDKTCLSDFKVLKKKTRKALAFSNVGIMCLLFGGSSIPVHANFNVDR